jgi:hypothetical protein
MSEITEIDANLASKTGALPSIMLELKHYKDNPRMLAIVSSAFAELMISTLIRKHCKNGKAISNNSRDYPFSVRLTLLYELDIISSNEYKILNWLRKLRNDAAHNAEFKFTDQHMPSWADSSHKKADTLFSLCVNILGCFWNDRVELFREKIPLDG